MFQVGIEPIDGSSNDGGLLPDPGTVVQAPVGMIDNYPADGVHITFQPLATTYVPTQQVFNHDDKWFWVKSVISYFDLSKFFVTADGYKVLISSQDNLVEGAVFQ